MFAEHFNDPLGATLDTSNSLARGLVDFTYAGLANSLTRAMFRGVNLRSGSEIASTETGLVFKSAPLYDLTNVEYFHPPCTFIAKVRCVKVVTSGEVPAFGEYSAGDITGFTSSPYLWRGNLYRNYTGPQISTTSSGAAAPLAGYDYLLVWRSFSDTSHQFEVFRSDGGYEVGTATTDTSAISFQDWSAFYHNNYSAGVRDYRSYGGGFWRRALSDGEVRSLLRDFNQLKKTIRLPIYSAAAGGITGTGALSIPMFTVDGSGIRTAKATGALTLPKVTASGVAERTVTGSGSVTLPSIMTSGSGTVTRTSSGAIVMSVVLVSGTGERTSTGSGAMTLPMITIRGYDVAPLAIGRKGGINAKLIFKASRGSRGRR